jgi:hypothetical protein
MLLVAHRSERGHERAALPPSAAGWMLALEAGYYDQSHLIAEVKELTGVLPGAWLAGRR